MTPDERACTNEERTKGGVVSQEVKVLEEKLATRPEITRPVLHERGRGPGSGGKNISFGGEISGQPCGNEVVSQKK